MKIRHNSWIMSSTLLQHSSLKGTEKLFHTMFIIQRETTAHSRQKFKKIDRLLYCRRHRQPASAYFSAKRSLRHFRNEFSCLRLKVGCGGGGGGGGDSIWTNRQNKRFSKRALIEATGQKPMRLTRALVKTILHRVITSQSMRATVYEGILHCTVG